MYFRLNSEVPSEANKVHANWTSSTANIRVQIASSKCWSQLSKTLWWTVPYIFLSCFNTGDLPPPPSLYLSLHSLSSLPRAFVPCCPLLQRNAPAVIKRIGASARFHFGMVFNPRPPTHTPQKTHRHTNVRTHTHVSHTAPTVLSRWEVAVYSTLASKSDG